MSTRKHWDAPNFRALMPEESVLHGVIAFATEEAGDGCPRAAQWFRSRGFRAHCLMLGISEATQRRIREHATQLFESHVAKKAAQVQEVA